MTQLSIFEARQARDSALARVESHASRDWLDEAFAALRGYLETHATMHVDDLAPYLPAASGDRRALGAVFVRAAREGLMEKTENYRPSVASNLSPKVVWRSLVWSAAAPGEGR